MAHKRVEGARDFEGIRMTWKNFRGEKGKFNESGKRSFAIVLDEDQALELIKEGWNVKVREYTDDEDKMQTKYYLPVNIKMDSKVPPRLFMITMVYNHETQQEEPRRTMLKPETVGLLDYAQFDNVDVKVRPFNYDYNGRKGVTHYLSLLFATLHVDDLEKKYAHIPMDAGAPELESAEEDILDVDSWEVEDDQPALPRGRS